MGYLSRLGLWGSGTPFPDFASFVSSVSKRGVAYLELLAMELKASGRYVARGLSFRCGWPRKAVQGEEGMRLLCSVCVCILWGVGGGG